jgi:hypothetical protein
VEEAQAFAELVYDAGEVGDVDGGGAADSCMLEKPEPFVSEVE